MNHRDRVYEDVFEMMPGVENPTPLVRLRALSHVPDFPLYAKLEWMNPLGSVKDRAAWALLRDLEAARRTPAMAASWSSPLPATPASASPPWRARAASDSRAVVPNKVPLEKKVLLRIAGGAIGSRLRRALPGARAGRGLDQPGQDARQGVSPIVT